MNFTNVGKKPQPPRGGPSIPSGTFRKGPFAALGALAVAVFGAYSSIFQVEAGHRKMVFDYLGGLKSKVYGEGMHLLIPFLQYPIDYEVRTRWTNIHTETGSKDLQTVGITLRLLFRPDPTAIPVIHQRLGPDYDERVLPSISNETLKAVVAQHDAGELLTQREVVSSKIRDAMTARLATEFNIILDDVSITHISFSPEYATAIESKQVAQQEAERSRFVVLKAEQEKKASIIRAQGEAEAARLISEAMKSGPGFIELRKIEAMREISETLSKSKNVVYLPGGLNMLMNMGIGGGSSGPQQGQ